MRSSTAIAPLTRSGRCSSRPLATLTTCERDVEATAHGVILSRVVLCPPRPPPPTKQHSSGNVVLWPPGPLPTLPPANPTHRCYPHTPTFHAPLMLPTHPMPRSLAVRHTHASACLCTAQSLTQPHPNLADSCGAVCAAARRSWSLLPVISFSVPLVFPTAQELACVSFRSVVAPPRHVACITSGHGGGYDDR